MIVLMRLYPKDSAESIWQFVQANMHSRQTKKVEPILASVQEQAKWVTLYVMSDDVEAIGDFIVNDLGKCDDILYTMTVPLLKMVFIPVSKSLSKDAKRYAIMIRCDLQNYYSAFRKVIDLHPVTGVNSTFSAFLLGKYDKFMEKRKASIKDIIGFATLFHNEFQHIHPFTDGNSRVTRLLAFHILRSKGIPILDIPFGLLDEYLSHTKGSKEKDDRKLYECLQRIILFNLKKVNERLKM